MSVLNIRGVEINFPFLPYDCQVQYMDKVIQCLQEGKNGILESPTGTGKTLCLLCATLAWRETYLAHLQLSAKVQENKASGEFCDILKENLGQAAVGWASDENTDPEYDIPKIIYTSRTHSQLTQAVNELKTTIYKPKVCVLASREQLCIHPDVIKQDTHIAKMHLCRSKVDTKKCHFYNNLEKENTSNEELSDRIMDIEDLVGFATKQSLCPYYMSRNQKKSADIIFMPYNYLIDAKSRDTNGIEISKSIIIFDEAHNIEKICEEAVSFDLTSFDIASCIEDLDQCLDTLSTMEMEGTLALAEESGNSGGDLDKKEIAYMKGLFLLLEEELHELIASVPEEGITKPGSYIFQLLGKVKITHGTQVEVVELIEKCCAFLVTNGTGLRPKQFCLSKFADALKVVFQRSSPESGNNESRYYKVHIREEDNSKKKQLDVWSVSKAATHNKGYSLGYWCFSPGETMKDLMQNKVRTMILTSGTLSPLTSFKAELQIDIPIELQNPHVIKKHQMFVGVLKTGPDGVILNSSYKNRNSEAYITSLGNAIVNFAQVVPDGMLVFFSSYAALDSSLKYWQANGVWDRLESRKQIFVEPRKKQEFTEAMEGFYEKVRNPQNKGAVFLAVCRGKVSEGVDFSDINGRAVVITGLPYPPAYDPRVLLKQKFLDEVKDQRAFKGLTGRQWYFQQASRAVNQAIGRVLRHKEDYGAIIFCDERFSYPSNIADMPKWMKPYLRNFPNFGQFQKTLRQFFRQATELCDSSSMKVKKLEIADPAAVNQINVDQNNTDQKPATSAETHSSNRSKLEIPKEENARKRDEKRREKLPRAPITIQYDVLPSEVKENKDGNNCTKVQQNGFFDSLQAYETKKQDDSGGAGQSSSKSCACSSVVEEKAIPTAVKRKLKIVRAKPQPENVDGGKTSKSSAEKTRPAVSSYIRKLSAALGKERYLEVVNALMIYKKEKDIESLVLCMITVLLAEKKYYDLYLGFSSFLKQNKPHMETYLQKYRDITGEDVPVEYEQSKRSGETESTAPNKKIRTDE